MCIILRSWIQDGPKSKQDDGNAQFKMAADVYNIKKAGSKMSADVYNIKKAESKMAAEVYNI